MNPEKTTPLLVEKPESATRDEMIAKAYQMYLQREARTANQKANHADLQKRKRRAKNKVARQSRKKNK